MKPQRRGGRSGRGSVRSAHEAHGGAQISLLDARDGTVRHDQRATSRGWYSYAAWFRGEGTEARRAWRAAYVRNIVLGDILCAAVARLAGYLVRFGSEGGATHASVWAAVLLPLIWVG